MFDGSTDKSVSEMELVYARTVVNGRANNMYVRLQPVEHTHAALLMVFTLPSTTHSSVWGFLTGGPRWLEWGATCQRESGRTKQCDDAHSGWAAGHCSNALHCP